MMLIQTDLFSFAFVPHWYLQLDELAELALPEPWRFQNPVYESKNSDTPILERYIQAVFRKQVIDYNTAEQDDKDRIFLIRNEFACFHTGLYTKRYKPIYCFFNRNHKQDSLLNWYFRGFADEISPLLRYVAPLPEKPSYHMPQYGVNYNTSWSIRVNVDHILGDAGNVERIPAAVREAPNLPLLLEVAVELARRRAVIDPGIVVAQVYQQRVQFLLPLCLTDMERPDLALALTAMDGYYFGNTCLTPEMAYLNARLFARPNASWLTSLV